MNDRLVKNEDCLIEKVKDIDFNNILLLEPEIFTRREREEFNKSYNDILKLIRTQPSKVRQDIRYMVFDDYLLEVYKHRNSDENRVKQVDAIKHLYNDRESLENKVLTTIRIIGNESTHKRITGAQNNLSDNEKALIAFLLMRSFFFNDNIIEVDNENHINSNLERNINEYFVNFDSAYREAYTNNEFDTDIFFSELKRNYDNNQILFFPIDEYSIKECIKKDDNDIAIYGDYVFKAERKEWFKNNSYYIRPYDVNNDDSFYSRDEKIKLYFDHVDSNEIVKSNTIDTRKNPCIYLAYIIDDNTKTLSECEGLTKHDLVKIISDVASGLCAMIGEESKIHHRGIRPSCIFVDETDNGYHGKIGCFETAKIETKNISNETVVEYVKEMNNKYIHPTIANGQINKDVWEKADIYSLTYILAEYINPQETANENYDFLYEEFTEKTADTLCDILESNVLSQIEISMNDFKKILIGEI